MNSDKNKVTVSIVVFNGEKYIKESIESILNQTFTDFELLIIDDGSTDNTIEIINSFDDDRIKLLRNETNKGIVYTKNRSLENTETEYFAVQDCDDIAFPNRLELQFQFLEKNPEIVICGTFAETMNADGENLNQQITHATKPTEIGIEMLFSNQFVHPSVMFRTKIAKEFGGYPVSYCEDYLLFAKICSRYKAANLPFASISYRQHPEGLSKIKLKEIRKSELDVLQLLFSKFIIEDDLLQIPHYFFTYDISKLKIDHINLFFKIIVEKNNLHHFYETEKFNEIIFNKWLHLILLIKDKKSTREFVKHPLFSIKKLSFKQNKKIFKIFIK